MADPDIGLGGISLANPDIRLRGQFNMFSSISRLFLRLRGPKSIAKVDGAPGRICRSPDPPLMRESEKDPKVELYNSLY